MTKKDDKKQAFLSMIDSSNKVDKPAPEKQEQKITSKDYELAQKAEEKVNARKKLSGDMTLPYLSSDFNLDGVKFKHLDEFMEKRHGGFQSTTFVDKRINEIVNELSKATGVSSRVIYNNAVLHFLKSFEADIKEKIVESQMKWL